MAFLSKFGNVLRQSASKLINSEFSPFKLWTHQAVRCMSSMGSSKLFIGGVSYQTDDASLMEAFGRYGDVLDARIIIDRESGRSRGFGFVTYSTPEGASSAIQALDGQDLHGRRIRVNYATEKPRSGAGNYGSGNSFETASGGGFGNNSDFGPSSGVGTGGADNFGVGDDADNRDEQFGYQNRA